MTALDVLLVAAVLVGMSVQAAIGFGFAFFVAPAAFAAFSPEQAVMLVLLLAIAINCLVLFGERRRTEVAVRQTATVVCAAVPGMLVGAWIVTEVDQDALQMLVGLIVLAGALVQSIGARADRPAPGPAAGEDAPLTEIGGGLVAGVLTTSVSVNGPALVLVFSRLRLRGARLRDSLAGALLGLSLPATVIVVLFAGSEGAWPEGWVLLACVPAVLIGHRFGAAVFRRLDDGSHHRAALGAAAIAGLLSIGAAFL
ncbi:MAG: TSUP family transporter [Solirubrobacterales bacterium]